MKTSPYLMLALTAACAVDTAIEDDRDDSFFVDGKTDTGGIVDGTPQALAVLKVANERTALEMTNHGVPVQAAKNIVAVRVGDDNIVGTADDVTLTTLAQLDAVPFVGPQAFARLLAYATDLGYLTPASPPITAPSDLWNVAACPRVQLSQLIAKFAPGHTEYDFKRPIVTTSRHRDTCNAITGCTPWKQDDAMVWVHNENNQFLYVKSETGGEAKMYLDVGGPSVRMQLRTADHTDGSLSLLFQCTGIDASNSAPIRCEVFGWTKQYWFESAVGFTYVRNDRLVLDGNICADGRFHFASPVPNELTSAPANLNQIAVYGRLF